MEIKLNLARNCLRYIIKTYNITEINIPYYICPTVIRSIRDENCHIKFYHIDKNFNPTKKFDAQEFILYPNYFGICSKQTFDLCSKYPKLIVDNAHNFYMPHCGFASFNSLRKFFPLKDGAILNIKNNLNLPFETDNYQYESFEKLNYSQMAENEIRLNSQGIKYISDCTLKYFNQLDKDNLKNQRLNKFKDFHERFKEKNLLKLNLTNLDVPFVYPYLTYDDKEAEILQQEGHIILRYWNNLPDNFPEYEFYSHLIPIPLM